MYKTVLFVCAQALLIQSITAQCIGAGLAAPYAAPWATAAPWAAAAPWEAPCATAPFAAAPWAAGPWEAPYAAAASLETAPFAYGPAAFAASNGGSFGVSSASPIPASGVSVLSENTIEGFLSVTGAVPFLGTVALEGSLPTLGSGAVNYGCGNGAVAILTEDVPAAAPFADAFGYGPYGYGAGPIAADAYGYGPLAGPYGRAGCGCGALI